MKRRGEGGGVRDVACPSLHLPDPVARRCLSRVINLLPPPAYFTPRDHKAEPEPPTQSPLSANYKTKPYSPDPLSDIYCTLHHHIPNPHTPHGSNNWYTFLYFLSRKSSTFGTRLTRRLAGTLAVTKSFRRLITLPSARSRKYLWRLSQHVRNIALNVRGPSRFRGLSWGDERGGGGGPGTDSLSLGTNCDTTAPLFGQRTAPPNF